MMDDSELPERPDSISEPIERVLWWEIGNLLLEYFDDISISLPVLADCFHEETLAIEEGGRHVIRLRDDEDYLRRRTLADLSGTSHITRGDREYAPADDVETWLEERSEEFEWIHPSYRCRPNYPLVTVVKIENLRIDQYRASR